MMSHISLHGMTGGTALILAAALARGAMAQDPHTQSRTSVVQQLTRDSSATPTVSGRLRELRCRGKPGIDLRIEQESSARQPKLVAMALRYERVKATRSVGQEGMGTVDYGMSLQFLPGTCTWNPGGYADIPPEPGVVYFDLQRDAQTWAAPGTRDTTINAAVHFPDVASLTRYLSDPDRYWVFYVDDVTNLSISFGSWQRDGSRPPLTFGSVAGALRDASPTLSSAYPMPTDSAARRPTVVQTPIPAGSGAGVLSDKALGSATTTSARAFPADSADKRTAPVRTPTPAGSVAGPLRDGSAGTTGTTSARAVPAESGVKSPGDAVTSAPRLAERRISNVQTAPGPRGVRLTFSAVRANLFSPSASIKVQFSTKLPSWDERERRWLYAPGWDSPWYAPIRMLPEGGYEAEPHGKLEAGLVYYYLITVLGSDTSSPPTQRTGSFTAAIGP